MGKGKMGTKVARQGVDQSRTGSPHTRGVGRRLGKVRGRGAGMGKDQRRTKVAGVPTW